MEWRFFVLRLALAEGTLLERIPGSTLQARDSLVVCYVDYQFHPFNFTPQINFTYQICREPSMATKDLLGSIPKNATAVAQTAGTQRTALTKEKSAKRASKKGAAEKTPQIVTDTQPLTEKPVRTLQTGLPDEVKRFIVVKLAQYESPSDVKEQVAENFGIEVSLPRLTIYACTTQTGEKGLGQKLQNLFWAEREKANRDIHKFPISHLSFRLKVLQNLLDKAMDKGDSREVVMLLEQGAKEMHRHYTHPPKQTEEETTQALADLTGMDIEDLALEPLPES
jgi:hypothetical protein